MKYDTLNPPRNITRYSIADGRTWNGYEVRLTTTTGGRYRKGFNIIHHRNSWYSALRSAVKHRNEMRKNFNI